MAERARSVAENAPGSFFVDSTCIDCATCRQLAPATYADAGEHSYVRVQPRDEAEARSALRALVSCPTSSIGTWDKRGAVMAAGDFPLAEHALPVMLSATRLGRRKPIGTLLLLLAQAVDVLLNLCKNVGGLN